MKTISYLLGVIALIAYWCTSLNIEGHGSSLFVSGEASTGSEFLKSSYLEELIMKESRNEDGVAHRSYSKMMGSSVDGGDAANHTFEDLEIASTGSEFFKPTDLEDGEGNRRYVEMIGPPRDGANHSFEVLEIESQEGIDSSLPIKLFNFSFEGVTPPV